jgi:pilus assembly protein CpaC
MAIKRALLILIVMAASSSVYAADETVNLLVGRSTVIDTGSPIQRVSLTSSDVADALVTSPAQLLVHGKTPGSISMFVWDRGGAIRRYDVTVQRDLSHLTTQVHDLFPAEHITIEGNGRSIVVAGMVSTKFVAEKAVEVAAGYVDKKEDVVNLLQVQEGGVPARQVLLRVRFAEVTRTALTQLGLSLITSPTGIGNTLGSISTQQYAAPGFSQFASTQSGGTGSAVTSSSGTLSISDFLNLFLFSEKFDIGALVKALQTKGLFQSLAEPNLVAESGTTASFLAGGEFPIPIAQGSGANIGISVQFKEYGIRLAFTPTIIGDRVHLKVKPEVSSLDFSNAVTLAGYSIPALTTRRVETEIELRDGQTFAIAGLLNNSMTNTMSKIPGIGDIPILGALFKSKSAAKNQTELVVMITPQILTLGSAGVTTELPRLVEPYLPPTLPKVTMPSPPPAFSTPRSGDDGAARVTQPVVPAAPAVSPAVAAAAAVSALTPNGPTMVQPPAPASAAKTPSASNAAPAVKPGDPKVLDKARRDEEHAAQEQAKRDAFTARQTANEAEVQRHKDDLQRHKDELETKRQERLAREQAKRSAEAAAKAAQIAAHQVEVDKQVAARQAEVDKKQQKVVDEASARLKAAQANYQSEIAKQDKP